MSVLEIEDFVFDSIVDQEIKADKERAPIELEYADHDCHLSPEDSCSACESSCELD